jgi:hypothetical protein
MTFKFSELCEPAEGRSTHPGRSLGCKISDAANAMGEALVPEFQALTPVW